VKALLLAALLAQGVLAVPPGATATPPVDEDEEVIRNLELLEKLDFLRHAELFDDGALSEREAPPAPPPSPPPPPQAR